MAVAIRETNFDLPGQVGEVYRGKVGDTYTIQHEGGDLLAAVRTDRISAYNAKLSPPIPHKGQVLNQMSAELLSATRDTAPNWLIESPDPSVSLGFKAQPLKVEMVMRGFLLGTAWREVYSKGGRELCGNKLPEGMREFNPFDQPLLTPTRKTKDDEPITLQEIVADGLATQEELDAMVRMSFDLFSEGQSMANNRGLLLADTKYEFGRLATGQIVTIDEVHTPDSSRYFPADEYTAYLEGKTDRRPEQLSKEFVREWLAEQGFTGQPGQVAPELPEDVVEETSSRYIELYETMLGHSFEPIQADTEAERLDMMRQNIVDYLGSLSVA